MLKYQRVLFCDDSIVRGTQLRDNSKRWKTVLRKCTCA